MNFDPRTKFWVTDPPATYEDESAIYVLVFSERRKLLDYYQAQGFETQRNKLVQRRMGKLRRDVPWLNWQGIMIDPDPKGGPCVLVAFDTSDPTNPTPTNL